jgi:hypothetical protein
MMEDIAEERKIDRQREKTMTITMSYPSKSYKGRSPGVSRGFQ